MVRKTLFGAGALLVAFHAWLFAGQIWSGELADPRLAVQWMVAGILIWALRALYRRGESIVRGRKAVAVWLLAALLHAPAVTDRLDAPGAPALPEAVATLAGAVAGAMAAIGIGLFLAFLVAATRRPRLRATTASAPACAIGPYSYDTFLRFAPRPPPAV